MRQTTGTRKSPGAKIVKDIKQATRKRRAHIFSRKRTPSIADTKPNPYACVRAGSPIAYVMRE